MTVSNLSNRVDYTGNGVTSVFSYAFRILEDADLTVITTDLSGVEHTLTLDTDYTVSGAGSYTGGNVTLTVALADEWGLTIKRVLSLVQSTSITNEGAFLREIIEQAFDRAAMVDQQLQEQIDRSTLASPGANTADALKDSLAASEFTSDGVGMIGYLAPFTGAVGRTQLLKNSDTMHVNDFGGDINAAISAMSDGMTLNLGNAAYGPIIGNLTKSIRIIGSKTPSFNAGKTALEEGSIIKGPLIYLADNLHLENLGVDSGSDVCTALYSGTAQEGLICTVTQGVRVYYNNTFKNVVCITKASASTVHTFAAEMQSGLTVEGLKTCYGVYGAVFKCLLSNVNNVNTLLAGNDGIYLKRDESANCNQSNFSNLVIQCGGVTDIGLRVESRRGDDGVTPGNLYQINIMNVVIDSPVTLGISIQGAGTSTDTVSDVTISDALVFGNGLAGLTGVAVSGNTSRVQFQNVRALACGTAGFNVEDARCLETMISGCTSVSCGVGFYLAGVGTKLNGNHAQSSTTYGYYLRLSTAVVWRSNNTGSYNGTADWGSDGTSGWLELGSVNKTQFNAVTFTNSWVNQGSPFGDVKYYKDPSGHVRITGAMKSGTLNTGAFVLPAAYRPAYGVRFACVGLLSGAGTLCDVYIETGGTLTVVSGTNEFVSLDGISFPGPDADPS